ncbi:benzoate/H(+) symporter BenE family transporter [Halomonas sp. McH1-25]|nr:benzoate/H(+) symporter BenE family transporter [Halomonas sp. McH1-25]MCP1341007.1 benzoate/H(+) symporter BenE family transporter [Halomonas sp. FL8]MCP1363218.1 benzoate/H(+) symporter BenE family transporter [Halomonas sp. BBD45]MCP1367487.1 benzoate/H(+) symporter BenE family transporter [Halomonas sp. BBD48]
MAASSVVSGFVAVLVGYTSSAAIIFQAAEAAGASQAQIGSWLWALGIGTGLTTLGFSLRYRMPLLTAWSTPGAALLATSLPGIAMSEAIGAFLFSALLITLCGATGLFERVMHRIPPAIASAMLAGVLLRFGLDVFVAMESRWLLPLSMFVAYLLAKRLWPRYAIVCVLAVGVVVALAQGLLDIGSVELALAVPVFTMPSFSLPTLIGVGIPLFVVTMASQNLPGIAVIRASGYSPPLSPLIGWTGVATLLLAPFGGFAFNLAAITAAICMGPEAHDQPAKRYTAAVAAGVFYLLMGVLGATVTALFTAFPRELIMAIAGLALLATIGSGLATAVREDTHREAALITFLVTASGISLLGIGSAFWGLLAGLAALVVWRRSNKA